MPGPVLKYAYARHIDVVQFSKYSAVLGWLLFEFAEFIVFFMYFWLRVNARKFYKIFLVSYSYGNIHFFSIVFPPVNSSFLPEILLQYSSVAPFTRALRIQSRKEFF